MTTVRLDFTGRLDGRTPLGDGSVRFTARLTRTGVFNYGDHKELRLADEVFAQASVDSFKGVAVTEGHQAFVDPENWRRVSVGHVGDDVHQDGEFLRASLVVKDKDTLAKIDRGDLVELSMGYTVNLDATPGEVDGQKYDAIQRDIRGNHAALGPRSWGRAGPDARLDGATAYAPGMTVQRIDAPSEIDGVRKDAADQKARADKAEADLAEARTATAGEKSRADKAEAERDAARGDAAKEKSRADAAEAAIDAKVSARVELLDAARNILPKDFDAKGKTDREIRVTALTKLDAAFKADGKSDDYVTARFDLAVEGAKEGRAALATVNEVATSTGASGEKSRLDEALERRERERAEEAKSGPPAGAMVKAK